MSRPFSRMKMKLWNLSDDDVPVKKTKKYKSKEEKEIKKTFENIAKKLLAKGLESIREEVEVQIRDSLNRSSSEIRHEVATIESTFSSRLLNLETKMNSLSSRIEETHNENSRKVDQIRQDLTTLTAQATQQIETERAKRLSTAKKLQEKFEQQIEAVQNNISTSKHDATATANALNEDLRLQVKEILGLKEKVDEILLKNLKGAPNITGFGFSQGYDSGTILDNISNRIQKLEQAVVDEGDLFNSFTLEKGGSPLRGGNTKKSLNRIRRIEEQIYELESQIKENETDIDQLKQSLMRQLRSRPESPMKERNRSESSSEIKEIERKVKKLAESTTRACRSLSSGLTDVQQATLSLYSWTDRVHDGFEVISQRCNLPTNLCPRAKLSTNNGSDGRGGRTFAKLDF